MSILTKICVVVLLVLILLAVPVFITQATIAPNWRYEYILQVEDTRLSRMNAITANLALAEAMGQLDDAITARNTISTEKQQEIERLTAQLSTWQTRAAELQNTLERLTTDVAGLKQEIEFANKRTDLLADQLAAARKRGDKLTEEANQLNDSLKQSEAEKERLNTQARDLKERLVAADEENERLRRAGGLAAPGADEAAPVPAEKITGTVTGIKGDYASISIGSAQGIKRNMRLVVYRGGQFVSYLRVEDVYPGQAAGIILDRLLDPIEGDKVTTRLK